MIPTQQPSEEQKEEFKNALDVFKQSQGENLQYQELLKSNPNLQDYFKKLIENYIGIIDELNLIDLLLLKDQEFSEIKIGNKSILRCLIEDFTGDSSFVIIKKHIDKFSSIEGDKDNDQDNLIASLLIGNDIQDPSFNDCVIELITILVSKGVKVDDENNKKLTSLDLCYNFEMFKALAEHASPETLEKKLRYIVENEDLEDEDIINIIKLLLTEKNVKIDGFFDWKWPSEPTYLRSIFAQIVLDHGNDEQKKCLQHYSSTDAKSPFFALVDDIRFNSEPLIFMAEFREARIKMAIILNKKEALEQIIRDDPKIFEEEFKFGPNPFFFAINNHKLDLLEKIIIARPEVLEQKDKNGLTPIFYAMHDSKLDALETIIKNYPQALKQKDRNGLTPVFHAIRNGKFGALKAIIETNKGALDQKDQQGNNPILCSLNLYLTYPSPGNKKILKLIFEKQFGRDLQDEEIENLVKFNDNYKYLKLFYDQSGQEMFNKEFKSILLSVLPQEAELEGELSKKLLKIYKTIAEDKDEPFLNHNDDKEKTRLHIYKSNLLRHASYFIFHVNDQNKLTKISYCDGHAVFSERIIGGQIGRDQSRYIYGATTFNLQESMDFIPKFAEDFVYKNSKDKSAEDFRLKHFSPEKLTSKEIFGIKFSAITHFIPTKMQIRGNCALKSSNILARFLLEQQEGKELFTHDKILRAQGGDGYRPYKDLRQKMVDKAVDDINKIAEQLSKGFVEKLDIYEGISSLYARSGDKVTKKGGGKTTKLTLSPSLLDKINRAKHLNNIDNLILTSMSCTTSIYEMITFYKKVTTLHFDLTDQEKAWIANTSKVEEVKIDGFLTWNFQTTQVKNNFIELVFKHGDEGKKKSFKNQLFASNPQQRNKFLEDLSQENLSLILTEFEKQKSKFGNLEQVIEVLTTKQRKDPHGIEDFMSDATFFDKRDERNKFVKEIERDTSKERKDAFIIKFCSDKSEENRKKFLNGLDPQCLDFMLKSSQAQLGKLKNVEKIIEELQKHVINFEGSIAGKKRSHDEMTESSLIKKEGPSSIVCSAGGSSASSEKMEAQANRF